MPLNQSVDTSDTELSRQMTKTSNELKEELKRHGITSCAPPRFRLEAARRNTAAPDCVTPGRRRWTATLPS